MKNRKKIILLVAVMIIIAVGCLGLTACGLFEDDPAPVVENKNVDMSGVTFVDQTFDYDGTEKNLLISGALPEGVTGVTYTGNGKKEVGEYIVTASFNVNDGYNKPADMTAKLTIRAINVTGEVVFESAEYTYDGTPKSIAVGTLPEGIEVVNYTIDGKAGNSATECGEYIVTASFKTDKNHNPVEPVSATLTIQQSYYDISGVVFEDKVVKSDGNAHSITATNLPFENVVVEYSYLLSGSTTATSEPPTSPGIYNVKATLIGVGNYKDTVIDATLTILTKSIKHIILTGSSEYLASYDIWYTEENSSYTYHIIDNYTLLQEDIDEEQYYFALDESTTAIISDLETLNSPEFLTAFSKESPHIATKVNIDKTVQIIYNQIGVGSITGVQYFMLIGMSVSKGTVIKEFILTDGYYLNHNSVYKNTFSTLEKIILFTQGIDNRFTLTAYQQKTVNLNPNGGSIANTEYTTFESQYPSDFNTQYAPSKTGHTFGGWYTDAELTSVVTSATAVVNGATLYAKWTANEITVNYDANGGATVDGTTVTYGNDLTVAAATTRTGYIFAGWNTAKNGSGTKYDAGATVAISALSDKDAVTLYAQWTAITYTVTFDANGGTGMMASMTLTYDSAQKLIKNTIVNADREFIEWNTKTDGSGTGYADTASVINLADTQGATVTLYAIWATGSYSIEFAGGAGAQGSMATQKVATDSTDTKLSPNLFTKTGYTFAGWTKTQGGSEVEYADGASIGEALAAEDATVTLYAVWTENQYTIQFVNEHTYATGTLPSDMTYKYTELKALTSMTFTIKGEYTFLGWTQSQDGSGTLYTDGETVSLLTSENNAVIKLYAQFKAVTVYIEYVYNDGAENADNPTSITYGANNNIIDPISRLDGYKFNYWTVYDGDVQVIDANDNAAIFNRVLKKANDGKTLTFKANYYHKYFTYSNNSLVFSGEYEEDELVLPTSFMHYEGGRKVTYDNITSFETGGGGFTTGSIRIPASYTYINLNTNMAAFKYVFIESVDNVTTLFTEGSGIKIVFAQSKEVVEAKFTRWIPDTPTCYYNGIYG